MKLIKPDDLTLGKYYLSYRKSKGKHKHFQFFQYDGIFTSESREILRGSNKYKNDGTVIHGTQIASGWDAQYLYELDEDEVFDSIISKLIINEL